MPVNHAENYEKRMMRVIAHMHNARADDLTLDRLAEVAAMSRFHFHRVFAAMKGETCAQAVRRIRLHQAAGRLLAGASIEEVAEFAGYANAPAFSRAFRVQYGVPPGQFRERNQAVPDTAPQKIGALDMFDVTVETQPNRRLAAMAHTGDYHAIGKAFEQVAMLCSTRNLWPQVQGMVGIYYDDPDAVPVEKLRSAAGVIVPDALALETPLEEVNVSGGKTAVLRFKGPYSGLRKAYLYLYGEWLPGSGEEARDEAPYEVYLNDPSDTAPDDLLTDICVPLK